MKFHHVIYWGNFAETDTFPIISQRGDGNFRFPSIFHRNLPISLKFPPKNYGEILIFFAVVGVGDIAPEFRGAFQTSFLSSAKVLFFHECSSKICKNSSVLKISRKLFRMSEMPLVKFEKIKKLY